MKTLCLTTYFGRMWEELIDLRLGNFGGWEVEKCYRKLDCSLLFDDNEESRVNHKAFE